jgi:hypothetical protein
MALAISSKQRLRLIRVEESETVTKLFPDDKSPALARNQAQGSASCELAGTAHNGGAAHPNCVPPAARIQDAKRKCQADAQASSERSHVPHTGTVSECSAIPGLLLGPSVSATLPENGWADCPTRIHVESCFQVGRV